MEDFIVERDGKKFVDVVKILPETLPSGKKILWKDIDNNKVFVSVDKHSARGGNPKPFEIKRFIPLCDKLFVLFGLWFGDGIKVQDGVIKLFGFANTELSLLKQFLLISRECLSIFPDQFHCVVSIPPKFKPDKKEIENEVSKELGIPLKNFWKTQVNPTRNFVHVDVKLSSRLLGFTMDKLSDSLKSISFHSKKFTSKLLSGIIASEANVHVRKSGRLGEIMIAIKEKEGRDWVRGLLKVLEITPNKDKEIPGQEGVLIHGISNFRIIDKHSLCSLHPKKNENFVRGLKGFAEEQFRKGEGRLLILKDLSEGVSTSRRLSNVLNRKQHTINFHLRHLEKKKLIRKAVIDGRRIFWEITEKGKKLLLTPNLIDELKKL